MKKLFALIAHLLTTLIKLARPGGVRAVAPESMALKHQLLVVQRTRKRASFGEATASSCKDRHAPAARSNWSAHVTFQVIDPEARPSDRMFPSRVERIAPVLRDRGDYRAPE